MSSSDQTIGLPQLVIILVLGGLAIRYFFFSSPENAHGRTHSSSADRLRAREADVERIQQMFPQIPRRSIMWDLQRNGGNVAATTERILSGMGLEVPPQSFQPIPPPQPAPASTTTTATQSTSTTNRTPQQPDLITRYNLQSKLSEEESKRREGEEEEEKEEETKSRSSSTKQKQGQAWSSNKTERQALLQRRRDEMILAARRKMEAKLAGEKTTGAAAAKNVNV
ncbi:hypothetical protein B7463_g8049, partial [Scytalidium lignicola]